MNRKQKRAGRVAFRADSRQFGWSCASCNKSGRVTMKPTEGMKPVMTAHFAQSPACKAPRLSID